MVSLFRVADGLISMLSKVRPIRLRNVLFSFLFSMYLYFNRCKSVLLQLRLPVFLVTGRSKDSKEPIQLLFVSIESFPLFLADLIFDEEPVVKKVGSVFVWHLHKLYNYSFEADAMLVSVDRFYERWLRKNDLFVFPHLVDMVLEVPSSFDEFYIHLSRSAKSDVKKVRNKEFTYKIVSDLKWLHFFYDSFYLPLIENRFADKPMLTPPFLFFVVLHSLGYQLLIVKDENGDVVSGCFFKTRGKEVFSRYNGVKNGDYNLINLGAESAIYYFLIDWAKKQGFKTVNFGHSRPFKNDGVFWYKQKWGAVMRQSSGIHTPEIFGLKIVKEDSILHSFFKRNPFFGIDKDNNFVEFDQK